MSGKQTIDDQNDHLIASIVDDYDKIMHNSQDEDMMNRTADKNTILTQESRTKSKTNQVGFVTLLEDKNSQIVKQSNNKLMANPWGKIGSTLNQLEKDDKVAQEIKKTQNQSPDIQKSHEKLLLASTRKIINVGDGGDQTQYRQRAFEDFSDDDSMDNDTELMEDLRPECAEMQSLDTSLALKEVRFSKWKNYSDIFNGLTANKNIPTAWPIVSMIITYDSSRVLAVTKKDDTEYFIRQFCLIQQRLVVSERFGGTDQSYIKMKDIEQNAEGTKYAIAFFDNGHFYLRTFDKNEREESVALEATLDVNKVLDNMNDYTMPIDGFPDPYITCTFVNDDLIFVNLFHNYTLMHHHFLYKPSTKEVFNKYQMKIPNCTNLNFPYKCFWNATWTEIYTFYRQGQALRINFDPDNIKGSQPEIQFEQIIEKDLGTMFLIKETCLVVRSSSQVLFFKRILDERTGIYNWNHYHTLLHKGQLYFIKGNTRINITTDEKVYFYIVDNKEQTPELENVMYNFMQCTSIIFGSRVRYGCCYKQGQTGFDVYSRNFEHDFKVNVWRNNLEKSMGISVKTMNRIFVSKVDEIMVLDGSTYEIKPDEFIPVTLLPSTTREINTILAMQICGNERSMAILTGKHLIKNTKKPQQIHIFQRVIVKGKDLFRLHKRIIILEIPELVDFCMQFYFQLPTNDEEFSNTLLFAKPTEIISFNTETLVVKTIVTFDTPLKKQPQYFSLNDSQENAVISRNEEAIFNSTKGWTSKKDEFGKTKFQKCIDLDQHFQIRAIQQVVYDYEDQSFYVMANRYKNMLGFFVIKFLEEDPDDFYFIIKLKNKLEINDANIFVMRTFGQGPDKSNNYKELVLSFKSIYLNSYSITVLDISKKNQENAVFRHESFQLWESPCFGFMIPQNKDFIHLNKDGVSIASLGDIDKRVLIGNDICEKVIHSLESVNYLKVDPGNFIEFDCTDRENMVIKIQQKHTIEGQYGEETFFENVYNISIKNPTLRELLLIQSIQRLNTQSKILEFVLEQPKPIVFYKSFLELDGTNFLSILSFDSRSMIKLLHEDQGEYFDEKYPLIYKNKIVKKNNKQKFFYRSAIDNALQNNQMRAIDALISYIVKYQNNFISSYLFEHNFQKLIEKGVEVHYLLQNSSKIFRYTFDYDQWISNHTNDGEYYRAYNGSLFELRGEYGNIFKGEEFEPINENEASNKIFKIKFHVNLLTTMCDHYKYNKVTGESTYVNHENDFLVCCAESDEMDIFENESVNELIEFKWQKFSHNFQLFGFFMHCFYLVSFNIYIFQIYVNGKYDEQTRWSIIMALGLLYPWAYDLVQLFKSGFISYFSEFWNYSDLIFVYSGILNMILQNFGNNHPSDLICKILMILTITTSIIKTFFFLRVFSGLSYLVTMLFQVTNDLQVFLLFYVILIFCFSQYFSVLGIANPEVKGMTRDKFIANGFYRRKDGKPDTFEFQDYIGNDQYEAAKFDLPYAEYMPIGMTLGNVANTFRMSLGDFDWNQAKLLTPYEGMLFWILFVVVLVISNIIFLNFIIAEASESYARVMQRLDAQILLERANMINECEQMAPGFMKNENRFPRYIIMRTVEK